MTIYSYGTEVEVVSGDFDKGTVDVRRVEDNSILKTYVYELKADGGAGEIVRAILQVYERIDTPLNPAYATHASTEPTN